MGLRKDVMDLVTEIGKIKTIEGAREIFKQKMDQTHLSRIQQIKNEKILIKIANAIKMCDPDEVFVNTGSEEDREFIKELALKKGEESNLPMKDHTIHYDLKEEQGRIIDRTFYIETPGEEVSSLAKKMSRDGSKSLAELL